MEEDEDREYCLWINNPRTKDRFDRDFKRKKISLKIACFFPWFSSILFALAIILFYFNFQIIPFGILILAFLIFLVWAIFPLGKEKLSKKEFLVYGLHFLCRWGLKEFCEEKEIHLLFKVLKRELKIEFIDISIYNKINNLEKDLFKFIIYLENKFKERDLKKLSNELFRLSKEIFYEKLEGSFFDKVQKDYGGSSEKKPSFIFILFNKYWKIILAIFIIISSLIFVILKKISLDSLTSGLIPTVICVILTWLLLSGKKQN